MFFKRLSVNLGVICTNDHLCFKIFLRHHMWTLYNSKHENSKTFLVLFFMKILQFCFGSTNSSLLLLFETEKPIWQPSSNVCTSRLILRSFLLGKTFILERRTDRQTDKQKGEINIDQESDILNFQRINRNTKIKTDICRSL